MSKNTKVELAEDRSASMTVVHAVADEEDVSPTALGPIARVVDPDALDALVDSKQPGSDDGVSHIEFGYSGYDVTVTGEGGVHLGEISGSDTVGPNLDQTDRQRCNGD